MAMEPPRLFPIGLQGPGPPCQDAAIAPAASCAGDAGASAGEMDDGTWHMGLSAIGYSQRWMVGQYML